MIVVLTGLFSYLFYFFVILLRRSWSSEYKCDKNGEERPIAFASRTLSAAEKNVISHCY